MWIVDGEIFESQKLAKARASDLNKTHALIHNLDVDDPPEIYKPKQVIHFQGSWENLCGAKFQGSVSTIFPDKINCPKCNQLLKELDED